MKYALLSPRKSFKSCLDYLISLLAETCARVNNMCYIIFPCNTTRRPYYTVRTKVQLVYIKSGVASLTI